MIVKGVIFDLDQTLVDTSKLESFRDRRMWSYVYSNFSLTAVYPSVMEMIAYLRSKDIKITVVTSSKKEYAIRLLKYHDIDYDYLVAYSDTRCHKPSPDPMIKALALMDLNPNEVLSVGDRENDVISGKRANIYSIIIGNEKYYADALVENTKKLYELVFNLVNYKNKY